MRGGLAVCLLLLARAARADDVDALVEQGEALAKQGEWTRAVTAFKAADAKRPRAKHACLIGLAYTRRELWAEAELFLSICQQRARADDPAPDWLAEAQKTLGEKLAAADAAPVAIHVEPAEAIALVHVSSFAPDETFAPRTIHLGPGTHTISADAPGYKPAKQEITIASSAPQDVRLVLVSTQPKPVPHVVTNPSLVPWIVAGAGGALALGAGAYDLFSVQHAVDDLKKAPTNAVYDQRLGTLADRRERVYWMLAGAGALVVTGVVLRFTVFTSKEEPVSVSALPVPGGGFVTIGWSR